jgi:hypothetical protein
LGKTTSIGICVQGDRDGYLNTTSGAGTDVQVITNRPFMNLNLDQAVGVPDANAKTAIADL